MKASMLFEKDQMNCPYKENDEFCYNPNRSNLFCDSDCSGPTLNKDSIHIFVALPGHDEGVWVASLPKKKRE